MLDALIAALADDDDDAAEKAAAAIAAHGAAAIPYLSHLLDDENPDPRWWAVRALAGIRSPEAVPLLGRALNDPDLSVRQCAARAQVEHPQEDLLPELKKCLDQGDNLLARLAGSALAGLGAAAVPALLETLDAGRQLARVEAARALAEIEDPRAIPVFFRTVEAGDSPLVEHWAEVGLQRMGIGMSFFKP